MVAFKIEMLSDLLLQTQETREILHFHYTTWPDFGVPESPASFLNFLFKVRESGCLNADHGPVVVHCSAGIGRSGTFCLVDTCLLLVRMKHCGKEMNVTKLSQNFLNVNYFLFFFFLLSHADVPSQRPIFCADSSSAAGDATQQDGLDPDGRSAALLLPCRH